MASPPTTNAVAVDFIYNPASQIASRTAAQNAYSWTAHYNEDLLASVSGLNQVTDFGAAITYDNRGNLKNDGTSTYGYDAQNRLASVTASIFMDELCQPERCGCRQRAQSDHQLGRNVDHA